MGQCSCDQLERSIKHFLTYVFSHVGLCTCVAGYSVAGAFLFQWLELQDVRPWYDSEDHRNKCLEGLAKITTEYRSDQLAEPGDLSALPLQPDDDTWRRQALLIITEFEAGVVEALGDGDYDNTREAQQQDWSFISSLFYCVTVITTIGYGHIAPHTFNGKITTIFYAVLGIPLFLLTLTNLGNSMASAFRFSYTRLCCCCVKKRPDDAEAAQAGQAETGEPPPYIPYPKYSPKRKKMLISPPISATLHRGNDLAETLAQNKTVKTSAPRKPSTSSSPSPLYTRSHPLALAPEALETRKLVAECSAYATNHIPGFTPDPTDMTYDPKHLEQSRQINNTNHDYDLLNNTMMLEPSTPTPTPSTASPTQSTPSSPLSRDAPVDGWETQREHTSLSVIGGGTIVGAEATSSSNHSTRPASPSWISPSSWSPRTESTVTWADEDPHYTMEQRGQMKRRPGKTLVVYNTLSGDALKQQSKIARKMSAMQKKHNRKGAFDDSTMFMDPATGKTIHGDMLGLNITPIPSEPKQKDVRVPIPIVLSFVACYIMIGALLFQRLEGWPLSDSAYFCFITLSTIGFGDFVPGKALGYKTPIAQLKLVASSLYLLFGLAVLAMSFNLVQEEVVLKCKAIAQYVGLLKD